MQTNAGGMRCQSPGISLPYGKGPVAHALEMDKWTNGVPIGPDHRETYSAYTFHTPPLSIYTVQ